MVEAPRLVMAVHFRRCILPIRSSNLRSTSQDNLRRGGLRMAVEHSQVIDQPVAFAISRTSWCLFT